MKKYCKIFLCLALLSAFFMLTLCVGAASFEFNNTDGKLEISSCGGHVSDAAVKNGMLSFSTIGADPQLYINGKYDLNTKTGGVVNADFVKQIEIRFASTSESGTFEIFFTSVDPNDGSYLCNPYVAGDTSEQAYAKNANYVSFSGTGSLDKFITLTIDQSKIKYWKGIVTGLRIDPGRSSDVQFAIDYIRFVGEDVSKYAKVVGGNGAVGTPSSLTFTPNGTITLPQNTFTKEGYVFTGWKTSVDNKLYNEGASLTLSDADELTITATWAKFIPETVRETDIRDKSGKIHGISFAGFVTDDNKKVCEEYGFIVTTESLLGDNQLCFGTNSKNGKGVSPDGVKYAYGVAYNKASGTDIIFSTLGNVFNNSYWKNVKGNFFTAVLTNIPKKAYNDKIIVRPYAKIDGEYVYGETIKRSVKDIAEDSYNNGNREDYLMDIIKEMGIAPGKTVCFLGDSITHNGTFIKELAQSYLDSEKQTGRYEFYNCGISGDTAAGALKRLDADVLSYNPDIVFIMFGMNDVGQSLYVKANYNDSVETQRQARLDTYAQNIEDIVTKLLDNGVEVILCTPTPYDDVTNTVNDMNAGLEKCAEITKKLAKEYNLEVVDHYKNMYDLRGTKYWGATDPIHPNALGHHVMAQSIMYDLGYIEKMDVTTPMTKFDKLNEERHTLSYNFRMFVMIERNLQGLSTTEAKLARAKELQAQQTNDHWRWIYQNYIDYCGKGAQMLEDVIRLTEDMAVKN